MAEKRETYSSEELEEMVTWFATHAGELPKEMQIDKATKSPNLALTIESCIQQARECLGNYKMQGAFLLLKKIRANIEKY